MNLNIDDPEEDQIIINSFKFHQPSAKRKSNKTGVDNLVGSLIILVILVIVLGIVTLLIVILTFVNFQDERQQITIILLTVGNTPQIEHSIKSILKLNKSKDKKKAPKDNALYSFVIGTNIPSEEFTFTNELNLQIFSTSGPYDITFFTHLISKVKTDYFYLTTTQWILTSGQSLLESKRIMEQCPRIGQVSHLMRIQSLQEQNLEGFKYFPALYSKFRGIQLIKSMNIESLITGQVQLELTNLFQKSGLRFFSINNKNLKSLIRKSSINEQELRWKQFKEGVLNQYDVRMKKQSIFPKQQEILLKSVEESIRMIKQYLQPASKVYQIQTLEQLKQLPFCIVFGYQQFNNQIAKSLKELNYSNFRVVYPKLDKKENYYEIRQKIKQSCLENTYLLFVSSPLKQNALRVLNKIHQQNKSWITYSQNSQIIEVFSVLSRVYDLLHQNDFTNTSSIYLFNNNKEIHTISLLQLCANSNSRIKREDIIDENQRSFFFAFKNNSTPLNRSPYKKLYTLSQDYQVNTNILKEKLLQVDNLFIPYESLVTKAHMFRAIDRRESIYLPANHSIKQLQYEYFDRKYSIGKYKQVHKQVRFCVTIMSHNNVENNRYLKSIKSVVQQKYQNYHIVFIDDNSDDGNMQKTKSYFRQSNFSFDRLTFVQNKQRNYATYNIINAAFNFCHEEDVQMLMDGDDQFIGQYAFHTINSAYQQNPDLWVVYSNYKTNFYQVGLSVRMLKDQDHLQNNRRRLISSIGPIRTWKVKVIHSMPIKCHKLTNGKWLDTLSDDAIQHPLIEISTLQRVKYVNEILYEYNTKYGNNDDSQKQKVEYRLNVYRNITKISPLKSLQSLQKVVKNKEVERELERDRKVKYEKLKFQ